MLAIKKVRFRRRANMIASGTKLELFTCTRLPSLNAVNDLPKPRPPTLEWLSS
jgi:hypothetical protein